VRTQLDFFLLTFPLIFTGIKKCDFWPYRSTTLDFEPPSFGNGVRYLNFLYIGCIDDRSMSLVHIGPCSFENAHPGIRATPKTTKKAFLNR